VVTEVYYPEETSTGYYLTSLAERLAGIFSTSVLCGQPNYSVRGTRAAKFEQHNGVDIYRASGTTLNRNVIPFRLVNMLTLGTSVFFHGILRFRRHDRVLVVTTPPNLPVLAALASLARGATYTLLIHDLYPDVLVAVGKLKRNSVSVRAIDFINRWLYKNAERVIVVGRDMEQLVRAKAKGLDLTISTIPNWAEIDDVKPQQRSENSLIRELGIENKLIVLHAGNIGHPTDVETIIECLKVLDDRFHFVFIGNGVKQGLLETAMQDHRLKNLTLLNPRPRSEQIEFLNACDVCLVSLVNGMYGAAMPSKTYNIMAAGKPILALVDDGSELAMVIDEDDIGWHLPPGDPEKLLEVLNDIYDKRGSLEEMGRRSRASAERSYSLETAVSRYISALS
jgi:glycosyltransferase involved in cell wall biosynthesis